MKKAIVKLISLSLVLTFVFAMTPLAAKGRPNIQYIPPADTELLTSGQRYSQNIQRELLKGSLLSVSFLRIANSGGGKIGILADTVCHVNVDSMYVIIYLDRYDESKDKWLNQKVYQYEFHAKDMPNQQLNSKLISFEETDQPSGHYYRLWAYHDVEKGGAWETHRTGTDGVLITSTP